MLVRLLYAAVALCLLGTRPEHPGTRSAPSVEAAVPAPIEAAEDAPAGIGPRRPDFDIPPDPR